MSKPSVSDRIERARSEPMWLEVVATEPRVLKVENESSGRIHTVVPNVLHCSCEDHEYRDVLCKHLANVAMGADRAAEDVRQAMTDKLKELQAEKQALRSEMREIDEEREQIETVRSSLDTVLEYEEVERNRSPDEIVAEIQETGRAVVQDNEGNEWLTTEEDAPNTVDSAGLEEILDPVDDEVEGWLIGLDERDSPTEDDFTSMVEDLTDE